MILKNQKYHGEQLLNPVVVPNRAGLFSGVPGQTLAWWVGAHRGAQSPIRCMPQCCDRPSGGLLGWFQEVSGPMDTTLLKMIT